MKYAYLLFLLLPLAGCAALQGDDATTTDTEVRQPPTQLEGPTYDPSNSPEPMTASTPLPTPQTAATTAAPPVGAPTDGSQPAYADGGPVTYGSPGPVQAPVAYGQAMEPKGAETAVLSPAATSIAPTLAGDWYNAADQREVVRFTPTHYTTFYDGELLVEEDMTFHEICPGDCRAGEPAEFSCFTITGPGGQTCYGIIRLTDRILELSMLGVSTETIIYQKLP